MKYIAAVSGFALFLGSPVLAGDYQGQCPHCPHCASKQQSDFQASQQTIQGEITGFRHVDFRSAPSRQDKHSLVRLQMEDGRDLVVDLGPKRNLDRINLQTGDTIKLKGHYTSVSGRRVFQANQLTLDDNRINIQRPGTQLAQQQQQRQQRGRATLVSGTIEGFKHVNLRNKRGQQQTHTLLKLNLDNGKIVAVNIGPKSRLNRLDLEKGDRIRATAHQGTINGQPVLLVDRLQLTTQQQQQGTGSTRRFGTALGGSDQ